MAASWRRSREKVQDRVPDGRHGWLRRWSGDYFIPSRRGEAAGLEEGVGDHRHQGVPVQARPGSAFEEFGLTGAIPAVHQLRPRLLARVGGLDHLALAVGLDRVASAPRGEGAGGVALPVLALPSDR